MRERCLLGEWYSRMFSSGGVGGGEGRVVDGNLYWKVCRG